MILYYKNNTYVLPHNNFIYEVTIFLNTGIYYSLLESKLFYSDIEIPNIIPFIKISSNIEVNCELYSAPIQWLLNNDFKLYDEQENKLTKRRNKQPIKKTTKPRVRKLSFI